MNNQPAGERIPHDDLALNLQWAAFNGYVPSEDITKRYEWERHGNPEQWIDVRWDRAEIERHHVMYVALSKLSHMDNETRDRIWGDLLGGQV